jgi:hypothetical protein
MPQFCTRDFLSRKSEDERNPSNERIPLPIRLGLRDASRKSAPNGGSRLLLASRPRLRKPVCPGLRVGDFQPWSFGEGRGSVQVVQGGLGRADTEPPLKSENAETSSMSCGASSFFARYPRTAVARNTSLRGAGTAGGNADPRSQRVGEGRTRLSNVHTRRSPRLTPPSLSYSPRRTCYPTTQSRGCLSANSGKERHRRSGATNRTRSSI